VGANIDSLLQHPGYPKHRLPFVVTTEPCLTSTIEQASRRWRRWIACWSGRCHLQIGLEAEHVVLDADGEVGVIEGRADGKGLFGIFAGEFAELEGAVLVAIDERGPVGLHAGGDGFAVEGVGVFGVVLERGVGEMLSLGDAILEALLQGRVDGGTLAGGEAVVVGEELDVEDAEEVELGEEISGGVGGKAETIVGVGGHPLLEVSVCGGKIQVVHGVVAIVVELFFSRDTRQNGLAAGPSMEVGFGLVAEFRGGAGDICQRVLDVALAGGAVDWRRGEAELAGDGGVHLIEGVALAGADVEDAAGGDGAGGEAGEQVGADGVVDVVEVAAGEPVAEDGRGDRRPSS
jgi:hypothetical protein